MPKKLPDGWRTTFCAFIRDGYTITDAGDATGVAAGTIRRHLQEDDELRELYAEARESVRDKVRNRIWAKGMELETSDPQTVRWALDHLVKWNLPEAKETQTLEITTAEPLEMEGGRRPVSLEDVISLARSLGVGLGAGLRAGASSDALSAAAALRPALGEGTAEPAAGPVAPD